MSWTPPGRAAAPEPMPVERVIWRVTKDVRAAEARIRVMAHAMVLGHELRIVLSHPDREDALLWSRLYRAGEAEDLRVASDGTLRDFERTGWTLEAGAEGIQ